jgi:hypothetical protein
MFRNVLRATFLAVVTAVSLPTNWAWAVNPNPLESAYWRFEVGTASQPVTPRNADVVLDSINNNKMRAFFKPAATLPVTPSDIDAAPSYTSTVAVKPLQSGLPNTLAMDFVPIRDIYAETQNIDNGTILPGGGFTVEAAMGDVSREAAVFLGLVESPTRWAGLAEAKPELAHRLWDRLAGHASSLDCVTHRLKNGCLKTVHIRFSKQGCATTGESSLLPDPGPDWTIEAY